MTIKGGSGLGYNIEHGKPNGQRIRNSMEVGSMQWLYRVQCFQKLGMPLGGCDGISCDKDQSIP